MKLEFQPPASPRRIRNSGFPTPHSRAAFTMVEIALCLAVIAFALVAIIGVLPIGMSVQKDNREQTIVNFDARYLMDALRSGAKADILTNYIVSITNYAYSYTISGSPPNTTTNPASNFGPFVDWYLSGSNASGQYYSLSGPPVSTPILTNGSNIIGILSRPKYTSVNSSGFVSNYITADFRAITGSATDQGLSQSSRDFAFTYRITPEILQIGTADPNSINYNASGLSQSDVLARSSTYVMVANLQNNLAEIRVRFQWPVLPAGNPGNGSAVFRTAVSGLLTNINTGPLAFRLWFFQPQTYLGGGNINTALAPTGTQ